MFGRRYRIRTYAYRNQNPEPYHLANLQLKRYSIIHWMPVLYIKSIGLCSSMYYRIAYFYAMLELYPSLRFFASQEKLHPSVRPFKTCFKCASGPRFLYTLCYWVTFRGNFCVARYWILARSIFSWINLFRCSGVNVTCLDQSVNFNFSYCICFSIFCQIK